MARPISGARSGSSTRTAMPDTASPSPVKRWATSRFTTTNWLSY